MTFDQAVEKVQGIMKDANVNDMDSVAIQIHFTNKDCEGTMYISTKNGQIDVQGYDYKDCDAAIELMYGDLTKILTGRLNAATAIEKGTARIPDPPAFAGGFFMENRGEIPPAPQADFGENDKNAPQSKKNAARACNLSLVWYYVNTLSR